MVIGTLALWALLGPIVASDPNLSDFTAAGVHGGPPAAPSWLHPLGTDALSRDVAARLAAGGRISLGVACSAALVASVLGVGVGVTAAALARSRARLGDDVLMRFVDVLLAMPFLLVVTTLGVVLGRSDATTMVLVLGSTGWTGLARVVRAKALEVMEKDFVLAARALGASPLRIAAMHLLPNVATTAAVLGTGLVGSMILAESVLGYLTVGIQPPDASWGRMLHEAETLVATAPLLVAAPAACIVLSMLGFHRLGDALAVATGEAKPVSGRRRPPFDVMLALGALGIFLALPRGALAPPDGALTVEPTAPKRGGVLRLATAFSSRTLDPAVATDEISLAVGRLVFGRLIGFDDAGGYAPELIRAWHWSDDARTLELTVRRGVVFQDGAPLGAADVKRSIERALDPRAGSAGASHFAGIVGFEDFRSGRAAELSGVRALSSDRVAITLAEPDATLPALLSLSFVSPVCPSVSGLPKDTRDVDLCGAGPFVIKSFETDLGVRLERNATYYEPGLPYLDGIDLEFRVRQQTQRYRFERGELDLVRELSQSDAATMRADPRWAPLGGYVRSLRVSAIFLDTERPPFDSPHLRRAVSLAIDPRVLSLVRQDVEALTRVVPDAIPGEPAPAVERHHDLAAALEAMKDAGYPFDPATGVGGYPEPIDYVTVPDSFEQQAAEVYQQQLERVGIRIRLRLLSFQAYLGEVQQRGRAKMGWAGWAADYPDALTFFVPNLVSDDGGDTSQNYAHFSDAELDGLIAQAKRETDPTRRDAIFSRAETIVHEAAPWIPTVTPRVFEVRQPWLFGYRSTPLSSLDLARAWIDRDAARRGGPP